MEFLQPIADLLGTSPLTIVIVFVMATVMIVAWYALKVVLKIATRIFVAGFAVIFLLAVGLYIFFFLSGFGG
jgi:hypothetical protein